MTRPASRRLIEIKAGGEVAIDLSVEGGRWPDEAELDRLCRAAVAALLAETRFTVPAGDSELSVVFTTDSQIRMLNREWRAKDKPTNVLSFPAFPPSTQGLLPPMLGDIVLAYETVAAEAAAESKPLANHVTHLIVHGLLHLIGYDHEVDEDAEKMEALERRILARLAIPDPYA